MLQEFYSRLLEVLKLPQLRNGQWRLLDWRPAWNGNLSCEKFVAFWWDSPHEAADLASPVLVVVNFGPTQGQCYLPWPAGSDDRLLVLRDLMRPLTYEREQANLLRYGLYIDLPPWGYHVFEVLS